MHKHNVIRNKLASLPSTASKPHTRSRMRGFTIVELLIVIVVIGILAALVLNAFSGAQKRAGNAQTAYAIEAYKKGLVAYATTNGAYPNYNYACLGQGYPNANCWWANAAESQPFSDALRTVMGNTLPLASTAGNAQAPMYFGPGGGFTVDGKPAAMLFYTIDSTDPANKGCPVGPIIAGTGYPNLLTSNPVGSTTDGVNQCWVYLPQP